MVSFLHVYNLYLFTAGDINQCDLRKTNSDSKYPNLIRKPMAPANFQHRITNSPATSTTTTTVVPTNSNCYNKLNVPDDDGQLATLYWHTHGSTFWQHLLNNTEHIDTI